VNKKLLTQQPIQTNFQQLLRFDRKFHRENAGEEPNRLSASIVTGSADAAIIAAV